jgi:hypothetical protein
MTRMGAIRKNPTRSERSPYIPGIHVSARCNVPPFGDFCDSPGERWKINPVVTRARRRLRTTLTQETRAFSQSSQGSDIDWTRLEDRLVSGIGFFDIGMIDMNQA